MEKILGLVIIAICLYSVVRLLEEPKQPLEKKDYSISRSYTWERSVRVWIDYPQELEAVEEALESYLHHQEVKERIINRTKEANKRDLDLIFNKGEAVRRFRQKYGIAV